MGNVQGPNLPPYYEEIIDFIDDQKFKVKQLSNEYNQYNKPIPISYNTCILRTLHIIFIIGVMCDIIFSSIYSSPFLLLSTHINQDNTLAFMGNISFIFMYILSFMSFIGLTICLCHFCCMVLWDPCLEYGPKACCKCEELWENIICIGVVPAIDSVYMCIYCCIFFIIFCISPALILYIGVSLFCRNHSMADISYNDHRTHYGYLYSTLTKTGELYARMNALNRNHEKIKTLFMKAVVHSLYASHDIDKHKMNCRTIIMYYCDKKNDNSLQEMYVFYRGKYALSDIKLIDCKEACLFSGCGLWIVLYAMVVCIFLICFGYSENNNNQFLWMYYIISYSVFLILFLLIVLLHYLDPFCRLKHHFAWTEDLQWSTLKVAKFAQKFNEIWYAGERYKCLQTILEQKWMVQLIMEYTEIGDMTKWPKFDDEEQHKLTLNVASTLKYI
eukprot:166962_1